MENAAGMKAFPPEGGEQKSPETSASLSGNEKDPLAFFKTCVRKEGICLSDRIWNQIEEIVDSYVA